MTNNKSPLITIITVVYNGEVHIEQTIQSILVQSYKNIEYIVIDGGSTDNTLSLIYKYEKKIDLLVSEPDHGIADAMNKGISHAKGKYIIFIHADDYLVSPESIESISFYTKEDYDVILCGILFGQKQKKILPKGFCFWMNLKFGNPHQGILCQKKLFIKHGPFNTDFKTNMDYDFFLRLYRKRVKAIKLPIILTVMRSTGISSQKEWSFLSQRFKEEKQVHLKNSPNLVSTLLYRVYWLLYLPYRKIRYVLS